MKKLKVLVVATSRKTRGGITSVVNTHMQGYQQEGCDVKWIESHLDRNVVMKLFYFVRSLIQFFFFVPCCDLVHIHVSTFSSAFRKSFYFCLAKIYRKKIIMHLHCSTPSIIYDKRNRPLYRFLFKHSDIVLVLSSQWKQYVVEALGVKDNVRILYNPIFSNPEPSDKLAKKNYILFAGTIDKRKGYHDLIKAFAKVVPEHHDWLLVFAGNGEIAEGMALCDSLGISSNVVFRGWVTGEEKDILFRESNIFCLPSYAEGFPMSVLDAWAYSLPVVCTPVGGILDVAINGENILLFNPGDIDEMSTQLKSLICDEQLRRTISENSHQFSSTIFNVERINHDLLDIYKELLKK